MRKLFLIPLLDELPMPQPRTDSEKLALLMEYLANSLASFQMDPADSPFQRGYEAAIKETETYARDL